MNRRVVLFARVSTDDRGQDTQSQLLALRTVAARFDWQVVVEVPLEVSAWTQKTAADVRRKALSAVREHRADAWPCGHWTASAAPASPRHSRY